MTTNVPAHILARQKRDLVGAAIGGITAGSPAHISIAGNRFTLIDDAGNEKPIQTLFLDVCVIDANPSVSRVYFDPRKPYIPGGDNNDPPICWSDNGIGASAMASIPQNTSCQLCPHAEWGSAVSKQTGRGVPACSSVKKIAVLVPGIDMVFLLRVPPASLKNWGKYCNTLAGHGVDLPDAITRVTLPTQGIMQFEPMGYVDEATAGLTDKAIAAKAADQLLGKNDRPWSGQADVQKVAYAQQRTVEQIAPAAPAQPMQAPPQPFGGQQAAQNAPFVATPAAQSSQFAAPHLAPTANNPSPFGGAAPATQPFGSQAGMQAPGGQFPSSNGPSAPSTASPSSPFGQPSTSSPTDVTPPKRTRGPNKTKAEAAPTADDGIPPFLRRQQETADGGAGQSVAQPGPAFGMDPNPPAPDAGVQAALDAAFRLPT